MTSDAANVPHAPTSDDGWVTVTNSGPGFRSDLRAGRHTAFVDEPVALGGTDVGPTPYDLLLGALAGCTAMTVRMYATRKQWPLEAVAVSLRSARSHAADCEDCVTREAAPPAMRLERRVELRGPLTDEQRQRMLYIADRCPVKRALDGGVEIVAAA